MSFLSETQAHEMPCPLAKAYAPGELVDGKCAASLCPVWRWRPRQADAQFIQAVQKAAEELGVERTSAKASRAVLDDPKRFGWAESPTEGWCGLGGEPKPWM